MITLEVLDRSGTPLADLTKVARNVNYAHSLNGGKPLTFTLPIADARAAEAIMRARNLVLVESDEVEPWSGYIVRPQWQGTGIAYLVHPIAARLDERKTRPARLENLPAGAIFTNLMDQANGRFPTGIVVGEVFSGGTPYTLDLGTEPIYSKLNDLMTQTLCEYNVRLVHVGLWEASLYERYGRDLTATVCFEYGTDTVGDPTYDEDWSNYANAVIAVGKAPDGDTNGNNDPTAEWNRRPRAEYVGWTAVGDYGYAESVLDLPDVSDPAMLLDRAHKEVETLQQPKRTLGLVLNRQRGLWSQFRDGDVVCVYLPNYGYAGMAVPFRVLGREIDDETGSMTVAGEIVTGAAAESLSMYKLANFPTGNGVPPLPDTSPLF